MWRWSQESYFSHLEYDSASKHVCLLLLLFSCNYRDGKSGVSGVCVEDHPNISTETCVDDPEFQGEQCVYQIQIF